MLQKVQKIEQFVQKVAKKQRTAKMLRNNLFWIIKSNLSYLLRPKYAQGFQRQTSPNLTFERNPCQSCSKSFSRFVGWIKLGDILVFPNPSKALRCFSSVLSDILFLSPYSSSIQPEQWLNYRKTNNKAWAKSFHFEEYISEDLGLNAAR